MEMCMKWKICCRCDFCTDHLLCFIDLRVAAAEYRSGHVIVPTFSDEHIIRSVELHIDPSTSSFWISSRQFVTSLIGDLDAKLASALSQLHIRCVAQHLKVARDRRINAVRCQSKLYSLTRACSVEPTYDCANDPCIGTRK